MPRSRLFAFTASGGVLFVVFFAALGSRCAAAETHASAPVTLSDAGAAVTLSNGIVSFEIAKQSGNIANLRYRDRSIFSQPGYLDAVAEGKIHLSRGTFSIVTSPDANGGDVAEVSITQPYAGQDAPFDLELHFVLRRGESAVRAYAVYQHRKEYPAGTMAQSRWVLRVNDALFETIAIDEERRY
jgi:rhamnogalacturonan endolyase